MPRAGSRAGEFPLLHTATDWALRARPRARGPHAPSAQKSKSTREKREKETRQRVRDRERVPTAPYFTQARTAHIVPCFLVLFTLLCLLPEFLSHCVVFCSPSMSELSSWLFVHAVFPKKQTLLMARAADVCISLLHSPYVKNAAPTATASASGRQSLSATFFHAQLGPATQNPTTAPPGP